ncbi:SRPBCC family protein [Actinoallomurus liliacearum]|uniref:SRPBCC family protein n=1 Tax=Actinoallomurus liliacearum TaxID=1080073 RepID=A0ABP8TZS0_9ACTN
MQDLHTDRLTGEVQKLLTAVANRGATSLLGKVEGVTGRLTDYSEMGGSGLLSALTGKSGGAGVLSMLTGGGGGDGSSLRDRLAPGFNALKAYTKTKLQQKFGKSGGKGKKFKITNIVETLDVGVPLRLAYNQWTQFEDFPSFMKKVESVEQAADEKLNWKAQVFWSHRTWESTILEQIPDKRIVWRSKGPKGWVDGAVTFHELAPELTRIALVLEYHPQGFFEKTGNLWRAQGRRARLEFKHFRRHVMTQAILRPDEIEGWRGEIRDSQVVKDHQTALREEKQSPEEPEEPEGREELEESGEYEGEGEQVEEPEHAGEQGEKHQGQEKEDREPEGRRRAEAARARRG